MPDLSTTYLGRQLKCPIVSSAGPLSHDLESMRRVEDAGAGAIVMYSLFEEQIVGESHVLDHYLGYGAESFAEAASYFPDMESYNVGPHEYLSLLRRAKETLDIPIIGSLNGITAGGWTRHARMIEEAGADALELNIYYVAADLHLSGADVERRYTEVVSEVREAVTIPLAVKIGPYFSSLAHMASRLADAGADGLVLFNRFYQPDFDLENLVVAPNLVLSNSYELRLPLRWIAMLYGRLSVDFALTTGVHTYRDVLKAMMAGANVAMMTSELLRNGPERIRDILIDMSRWMDEFEYRSVGQMRGSLSQRHCAEPAAYERANYMKVLDSWRPDPAIAGPMD